MPSPSASIYIYPSAILDVACVRAHENPASCAAIAADDPLWLAGAGPLLRSLPTCCMQLILLSLFSVRTAAAGHGEQQQGPHCVAQRPAEPLQLRRLRRGLQPCVTSCLLVFFLLFCFVLFCFSQKTKKNRRTKERQGCQFAYISAHASSPFSLISGLLLLFFLIISFAEQWKLIWLWSLFTFGVLHLIAGEVYAKQKKKGGGEDRQKDR